MAKVLQITAQYHSMLYDKDTGFLCATEKVVDITEDCPKASEKERCIILFTNSKRGRIVQITRPYEEEVYIGRSIHFFVDELDKWMNIAPRDDVFGTLALELGLSKQELRALIEQHAPSKTI